MALFIIISPLLHKIRKYKSPRAEILLRGEVTRGTTLIFPFLTELKSCNGHTRPHLLAFNAATPECRSLCAVVSSHHTETLCIGLCTGFIRSRFLPLYHSISFQRCQDLPVSCVPCLKMPLKLIKDFFGAVLEICQALVYNKLL